MRRKLILLTLMAVLLFPTSITMARPLHTPHEDPATAEISIYVPAYLIFCTDALGFVHSGDYQGAASLLEQLGYAHIPRELVMITRSYNGLVAELGATLSSLEEELDEARSLLEDNRLGEAEVSLARAETLIDGVGGLVWEAEDATEALLERLGPFIAPALEGRVEEAYERLWGMIHRLDDLKAEYAKLLGVLQAEASAQEERLVPTGLTLETECFEVPVGQTITVWGELTSGGVAFPGREVTVLLDGVVLATAFSEGDGFYQAEVEIPFRYVRDMILQAWYIPTGEDKGLYLACQSLLVQLEVMFYQTGLDFTAPIEAYPGLELTINGSITSSGLPTEARGVEVLLDGVSIVEEDVAAQFELTITVPPSTQPGTHTLTILVKPYGLYAGASMDRALNIVKVSPELQVSAPTITISPSAIRIDGRVSWDEDQFGAFSGAKVMATLGEVSAEAETSADGGFSLTLSPPLDMGAFGPRELIVAVHPAEPWFAPAEVEMDTFIINPIVLTLILSAFFSVGVVVYRRRGTIGAVALPSEEPLGIAIPPSGVAGFEGVGGVLGAYGQALRAAEAVTGMAMKPHTTLREFLGLAFSRLGRVAPAFGELTSLAERALYSPRMLGVEEVARAEELSRMIKEELER